MNRRNFLGALISIPILGRLKPQQPGINLTPEQYQDIKNWVVDQVSDQTRKAIFINGWSSHQTRGFAMVNNRNILRGQL